MSYCGHHDAVIDVPEAACREGGLSNQCGSGGECADGHAAGNVSALLMRIADGDEFLIGSVRITAMPVEGGPPYFLVSSL